MRAELQRIAEYRGENRSVILREAALEYFERHPSSSQHVAPRSREACRCRSYSGRESRDLPA
jgi:hypothetical protein